MNNLVDTARNPWDGSWDVVVVGNGLAGSAAALFAAKRGLKVAVVGTGSQLPLSSGLFDLAGMVPGDKAYSTDPWQTVETLVASEPDHPYGKIGREAIGQSFQEFLGLLEAEGLGYQLCESNARVVTSVGTIKASYALPETMAAGATAFEKRDKTLIVGIRGLKGFQANQVAQSAAPAWPGISSVEIAPEGLGRPGDIYPEALARELDLPAGRDRLVQAIRPHLDGHKAVGLPPIFGMERSRETLVHLEDALGVPCFEIPGMPPTAAGVRLREALDRAFSRYGVATFVGGRVTTVSEGEDGFSVTATLRGEARTVFARRMILATGRFMGGGLAGDRHRVTEPLLDLYVTQPASRDLWHRCDLFHSDGHAVNRAGVTADSAMRPLDKEGNPVSQNLFVAGSILAHQDWKREKSGAGISIATAFRAAESCGV
ncbi:glycerol-3-phosphate dehydrogenase subunit GlpB [Desulfoluna spongiiphila]|uniref:Glycerol 3-phosphate dehydrogenase (Quinone) subunit B n=1 Tax=Desulfoluna spongiiphila TaxID=419481 RepID=A0A1G5I2H8_9BACT|nr:glycerol-3-phosphate dehydrogenase subunit GlpB [Desulfoluna spongiiphila]SCY70232.1 glycerol 3-phosphate dehydrogenase (quinone) subunit B [Desulfoluna spongiiphila]